MPSIVDPSIDIGGAWTVTRGLLSVIRGEPLNAEVHVIPVSARSRASPSHTTIRIVSPFSGLAVSGENSLQPLRCDDLRRAPSSAGKVIRSDTDQWKRPVVAAALPAIHRCRRPCVAHNVEHELFADQIACQSAPALLKALLRRDCERLRAFELENLERIHNVIFLSQRDADSVRRHGLLLNAVTVPPLFDPPPFRGHRVRQPTSGLVEAGMIANFKWWPNRQALAWFLRDVMPRLNGNRRIHLFGPASERATDHAQLVRHGYVDDIEAIWQMCDFMISPLIRGGGVSVKTAHAISQRVPIVATSQGGSRPGSRCRPGDRPARLRG